MLGQATEVLAAQGTAWLHLATHEHHANRAPSPFKRSASKPATLLHALLGMLSRKSYEQSMPHALTARRSR